LSTTRIFFIKEPLLGEKVWERAGKAV